MNHLLNVNERISKYINDNEVVLFMKGVKEIPQCGFSATVVRILDILGLEFLAIDVLADHEIREGIKAYSSWPTIPQLYIKGEFIGGCDIVKEMYETGDLQKFIAENNLGAK